MLLQIHDHGGDHPLLVTVGALADAGDSLIGMDVDVGPLTAAVGLDELDGDVGYFHGIMTPHTED